MQVGMAESLERERAGGTHRLITSFAGTTIMPANGMVIVKAGGEEVEKRAQDLQPGDKVLERGTSVKISISEIKDELLKNDAEYQAAHSLLYHYPEGSSTPQTRLAVFLRDTVSSRGFSTDFTVKGNKIRAAREIMGILAEQQQRIGRDFKRITGRKFPKITRSRRAVEGWLMGKTRLPDNPVVMRMLYKVNPAKFRELFGGVANFKIGEGEANENYPPLWAAYHLHRVHDGLRVWFAGISQRAKIAEKEQITIPSPDELDRRMKKNLSEPSLAKEMILIYNRYIGGVVDAVDREHNFITVKSIKEISTGRKRGIPDMEAPTLRSGAVLSSRLDSKTRNSLKLRTMKSLYRERMALSLILEKSLAGLSLPLPSVSMPIGGYAKAILELYQLSDAPEEKVSFRDPGSKTTYRTVTLTRAQIQELGSGIYRRLQSGELDAANRLERGTMLRLIQRERDLTAALPVIESIQKFNLGWALARRDMPYAFQGKGQPRVLDQIKKGLAILAEMPLAYGIDPRGVIYPENSGIRNSADLKVFMNMREAGMAIRPLLGGKKHLEMPLTEKEVTGAVAKVTEKPLEVARLVQIFGRHNFIR